MPQISINLLSNYSPSRYLASFYAKRCHSILSFVATLLHPAFFTAIHSRNLDIKINPRTGDQEILLSKVVNEYLHVEPCKGVFVIGQETPQVSLEHYDENSRCSKKKDMTS